MAVALQGDTKVWQRRERGAQFAVWAAWLVGAAIFVYCWQLISDKTIWAFVIDAPAQAGRPRRADGAAGLGLHQHAVAADLGHPQHRHARHR